MNDNIIKLSTFMDGNIDEFGLWNRVLTANWPEVIVTVPATNGVGFFRNVTSSGYWKGSLIISTSTPTP